MHCVKEELPIAPDDPDRQVPDLPAGESVNVGVSDPISCVLTRYLDTQGPSYAQLAREHAHNHPRHDPYATRDRASCELKTWLLKTLDATSVLHDIAVDSYTPRIHFTQGGFLAK